MHARPRCAVRCVVVSASERFPGDDGVPKPGSAAPSDASRACDFDRVTLRVGNPVIADGSWPVRDFDAITLDGVLRAEHEAREVATSEVLEIVASDTIAEGRALTVIVDAAHDYGCDEQHPRVVVYPLVGERFERRGESAVELIATACALSTIGPVVGSLPWLAARHLSDAVVNELYVIVDACGARVDGHPARRHAAQLVRVYPHDTWTFGFKLPPGKKDQRAWEQQPDNHWRDTPIDATDGAGGDATTIRKLGIDPLALFGVDDKERGWSIRLRREAGTQSSEIELFPQWLDLGRLIAKAVAKWFGPLAAPKVQLGWRFTAELVPVCGTLEYQWAFRESAGRTVDRWWKLDAELTLFAASIELSFGFVFRVWKIVIEAVVYASTAFEAAISVRAESRADALAWEARRAWEVPIRGGVRAKLGADWITAKGELAGGFALALTMRCGDRPFEAELGLDSKGIRATLSGEIKLCGLFATATHAWVFTEPSRIWPTSDEMPTGAGE